MRFGDFFELDPCRGTLLVEQLLQGRLALLAGLKPRVLLARILGELRLQRKLAALHEFELGSLLGQLRLERNEPAIEANVARRASATQRPPV